MSAKIQRKFRKNNIENSYKAKSEKNNSGNLVDNEAKSFPKQYSVPDIERKQQRISLQKNCALFR